MVSEKACEKCNRLVPFSDLKLVFRGRGSLIALCPECRANAGKVETKPGKVVVEKKVYYCAKCRYKFKFNPESGAKLHCPFCGDTHYVSEHTHLTSEALLKNADKE